MLISAFLIDSALVSAERAFVHTGALNTRDELDFLRARIAAGEQPWKEKFRRIGNSTASTRGPSQVTHIFDHHGSGTSRDDALAANTQALLVERQS